MEKAALTRKSNDETYSCDRECVCVWKYVIGLLSNFYIVMHCTVSFNLCVCVCVNANEELKKEIAQRLKLNKSKWHRWKCSFIRSLVFFFPSSFRCFCLICFIADSTFISLALHSIFRSFFYFLFKKSDFEILHMFSACQLNVIDTCKRQ